MLIFGVPVALYLNFTLDDTIIVALTLFYIIFVVSSQGNRFFVNDTANEQKTLSDFN